VNQYAMDAGREKMQALVLRHLEASDESTHVKEILRVAIPAMFGGKAKNNV
jgi:hypothetical protein